MDASIVFQDLPDDWNDKPPQPTQTIGDDFVNYNKAAVLKVPGSIVSKDFNYLINHTDAAKIRIVDTAKMSFDSRFKMDK